jgi:glutamate racemase
MSKRRILLFDSGMGGLTVANAVRAQLAGDELYYAADNAAFPYGAWKEPDLIRRIIHVVGKLIEQVQPHVVVIACNTASTIAMIDLRRSFALPFVGTVPAIKPAGAMTKSNIIGVLATPGTVAREYTHSLVHTYAYHCDVTLHGAARLAQMAESKLKGHAVSAEELRQEVMPVYREKAGRRTDVVVLGCTHYPLLLDEIRAVAPWEVSYLDPAPAIARRVADVLADRLINVPQVIDFESDTVFLTSPGGGASESLAAYAAMGFSRNRIVDLPAG